MKLFFDTEFTGLHQSTTLISLGIIAEDGRTFYAEFTDYDKSQINEWLQKNVLDNLTLMGSTRPDIVDRSLPEGCEEVAGSSTWIKKVLLNWLTQFDSVEFWSDCLAYDWVLLNGLISDYSNGYPMLPKNVYYIPFDLATYFKVLGIDPDISRKEFSGLKDLKEHNALDDAKMIKACFENAAKIKENSDLKKQLAIAERALLILGAELEKWKCPFDFEYCEKNCHKQTAECWRRVAKVEASAEIEKEAAKGVTEDKMVEVRE